MVLKQSIPRILVTGKDGQVGFELQRALAPCGLVIAVGRAECDLTDADAIRAMVMTLRPDIIVNPAAYTAVDKAEVDRDIAFAVNAIAPGVLAEEAAKTGALLVHYSTDYVFDGCKTEAYSEQDPIGPKSAYGQSKLAGEMVIRSACARHFILRTSWVFGVHGANFLKTILRLAGERDSLRIVADQFGAPTSAGLIADVTAEIVSRYWGQQQDGDEAGPPEFGTYHLAAGGVTSWHGYAEFVARTAAGLGMTLALRPDQISPISTAEYPLAAPRPANSRLNTEKLQSTFNIVLPDWKESVADVVRQLNI